MEDLRQRIIELEQRVELLEAGRFARDKNISGKVPDLNRSTSLVQVSISNKRYAPQNLSYGQYEDHIWFDVTYMAGALGKPTRALKGLLSFSDLFGEIKFQLNVTLNERLEPGRPFVQNGIGFTYNQFMQDHQWMLSTSEADMKISFLVTNVIYADGSSEEFR